jgi:hypothetical protein
MGPSVDSNGVLLPARHRLQSGKQLVGFLIRKKVGDKPNISTPGPERREHRPRLAAKKRNLAGTPEHASPYARPSRSSSERRPHGPQSRDFRRTRQATFPVSRDARPNLVLKRPRSSSLSPLS